MASRIEERIKSIEAKLAEAKRMKKAQEALKAAKLTKAERAADTRKKILVGASVLLEAANDPVFSASLAMILEARLTRDDDRKLLGLEPLPARPGQRIEGAENGENP